MHVIENMIAKQTGFFIEKKFVISGVMDPAIVLKRLALKESYKYKFTDSIHSSGDWHYTEIAFNYKGKQYKTTVWTEKSRRGVLVSLVTPYKRGSAQTAHDMLNDFSSTLAHLV